MVRTKEHNKKIAQALVAIGKGKSNEKQCPRCKKLLPRKSFRLRGGANSKGERYSHSKCETCEKEYNNERQKRHIQNHPELKEYRQQINRKTCFRIKYGITLEDYQIILEKQSNVCAICKTNPPTKRTKYLFVDHCHKTGKVRGLLCQRCNSMIGYSKDNIEILKSAIIYLTHNI